MNIREWWKWSSLSCIWLLPPHRLYSPWNSPGKNTGVGSLSFLQGIFPTQGPNPGLPHYRQIPYQLSHEGSLRILEWVDYPFFTGSSQPRNGTGVSCIAGRFFTNWAIREVTGCENKTKQNKTKQSERMEIEKKALELLNKCSDGPLRWNYAKIRKRKGVNLLDTWIKIFQERKKKSYRVLG